MLHKQIKIKDFKDLNMNVVVHLKIRVRIVVTFYISSRKKRDLHRNNMNVSVLCIGCMIGNNNNTRIFFDFFIKKISIKETINNFLFRVVVFLSLETFYLKQILSRVISVLNRHFINLSFYIINLKIDFNV